MSIDANNSIVRVLASSVDVRAAIAFSVEVPADASVALPTEILYMPVGTSIIHAGTEDGAGYHGPILLDEEAARDMISSFGRLRASGHRAWIDANHDEGDAMGDVRALRWDPARGLIAVVEWTPAGERKLRDRALASFSPSFRLDRETHRPTGLFPGAAVGGLVNSPAFGRRLQLIAAAAAANKTSVSIQNMNLKDIAKALGLAETATIEDILAAVTALTDPAKKAEVEAALATAKADAAKAAGEVTAAKAAAAKADAELVKAKAELAARPAHVSPGIVGLTAGTRIDVRPGVEDSLRAFAKAKTNGERVTAFRVVGDAMDDGMSTREVGRIIAANNLGAIAPDVIALRSLDQLKTSHPLLSAVTTDFSDEEVQNGAKLTTRVVTQPAVGTYNPAAGGYVTQDAVTIPVEVTASNHRFVQIEFNAAELATGRDLFGEQVEAMHAALGDDMTASLYALITPANFAKAVVSAAPDRKAVIALAAKIARTPRRNRTLILASDATSTLAEDPTIASLAAFQRAGVIEEGVLPRIHSFDPFEAVDLPAANALTGFGFHRSALVLLSRLPSDYTRGLDGVPATGAASVLTNPDTGLSLQSVRFVDHRAGSAVARFAWVFGVGKGNPDAGVRLTSI